MTPLFIEFMLRCYYSAEKRNGYPEHQWNAPALEDARAAALSEELVHYEEDSKLYRVTDKGQAYVAHLCAVSLPEEVTRYVCMLETKD